MKQCAPSGRRCPPIFRTLITKGRRSLGTEPGTSMPMIIPGHYVKQQYLPDEIKDARFYEPGVLGYEKKIKEHLEELRKQ